MNDKYTLRDFLVYFTTGTITILTLYLIFFNDIHNSINNYIFEYKQLNDFTGLLVILAVPLVYFIGHIVHGLDYLSLKIYISIHRLLNCCNLRRYKTIEFTRQILHFIMYRHRVINSVILENKKNNTWKTEEEFWITCTKLQKAGTFGSAEYWYALNDLFKGLYTIFFLNSIVAFGVSKTGIGLLLVGLMLICHFRAIQFANNFVKTVKRLTI